MITATVDGHRVILNVTPDFSASQSITSITRSDANGNAPLRVPPGTYPVPGGTTVLTDWEAALTGTVTYTSGEDVARVEPAVTSPCLVFPFRVGLAEVLDRVTDYSAARASLSIAHQVPDRPAPLVALGDLALRTGTLEILCADLAEARRLEASLDKAGVALLKSPDRPGMDMYFTVSGCDVKPEEAGKWVLAVAYLETTRPAGNLATWTFKALKAAFATMNDIKAGYATFNHLARDERAV